MERLIDDLLAFSRNGRAALTFQRVRLDAVVCHALQDVRLQSAHVTWSVRALPEVQGDPAMLRQVFANLLDNAAKYTRGRPGAQVEMTPSRSARRSDRLRPRQRRGIRHA
jgi:signal transduction histidine kinase